MPKLGRKGIAQPPLYLSPKNPKQKTFGLAKFYFGLVRFVCDLLLITAKLNNKNTEFLWWWVVGGSIPIM